MTRQLRVDFIQSGVSEPIGFVQGSQIMIGREPDEGGIAVPNQAVSRNHGIFVRFRTHWFYKDLGSTNGSWINGMPAKEGVWKLVRSGDVMQLADAALSLTDEAEGQAGNQRLSGFPALGGVSLLVFSKTEFLDEYPVPEYGRALIIGGSQGDLQIEGTLEETPNLVIERRSMNVCAFTVAKTIKVSLNDSPLVSSVNLNDRDELRVAHYFIIFNNPIMGNRPAASAASVNKAAAKVREQDGASPWKEWGEHEKVPDYGQMHEAEDTSGKGASLVRGVFGRSQDDEIGLEETVAIDPADVDAKVAGFDMHPSMRYVMDEPEPTNMASLDEKIIFVIGILLLLGLVALMLYWLLA